MQMKPEQRVLNKLVERPRTAGEVAEALGWQVDTVRKLMPKLTYAGAAKANGTRKAGHSITKVYVALRSRVERPPTPDLPRQATPWDALLRRS